MNLIRSIVVFVLVFFALPAQAQYKVSTVSIGSGETPIASGLSASVDLTNANGGFIEVMAQSQQAWFMAGKDWKFGDTKCSLYGSVGHFQSAAWVGPYAGCDFAVAKVSGKPITIGAMTWPGYYLGREPSGWRDDGVKNPESVLVGYFSTAKVAVGGLNVNISHLNFLDDKTNWLPGVGYTQSVSDTVEVAGSVTWNSNKKSPMFFVGANLHPKK